MKSVKLTIIVTSIEKHREFLLKLIESYLQMKSNDETEILILFREISDSYRLELEEIVKYNPNISIFLKPGFTKCERKDYGAKIAHCDKVAYVDSDCIFDVQYYIKLRDYLDYSIVRGHNEFLSGNKWFPKMNSIYRNLCDEDFFKNETFCPNLVISRELLFQAGGWNQNNLDCGDDYVLSQRIHRVYHGEIFHVPQAILYNQPDNSVKKTIKTWYGYGLGYGFRYWRSSKSEKRSFLKFLPPLVYRTQCSIDYFFFSIFQWLVVFIGYIVSLIKYREKKQICQ